MILSIEGNPISLAMAQVASTILERECQWLNPKTIQQTPSLPQEAVLILTDNQILPNLALLRLQGFAGAVLVLSYNSPERVKENYPILYYGISSHRIVPFFWPIPTILGQIIQLKPMGKDNLNDLKKRLQAPIEKLDEINLLVENIEKSNNNLEQNLNLLKEIFLNLLGYTPDFAHEKFDLADLDPDSSRIKKKFNDIIETIRNSPENSRVENLAILRQVFQRWLSHVTITGEGLGSLDDSN